MYTFSKMITLFVSIVLAVTLSSCAPKQTLPKVGNAPTTTVMTETETPHIQVNGNNEVNEDVKEKLLNLINNEETADKLIKTTYSEDVLQNLKNNIGELFAETPPECVRLSENKDVAYIVYKCDNGRYAFWLYSIRENTGSVMRKWYCGKSIYLDEFEKMKNENATLEDVQKFDPYGSYTNLYMGLAISLYTYHYTIDGYMIRLDYGPETGTIDIINKITVFSGVDNPVYYNLLPIDKQLLK